MDITVSNTFLPHTGAEAALGFYRDVLGFEVRNDVGNGDEMRWITVGAPGQETSIVLYPPSASPGITEEEKRIISDMMAKGTYGMITFASPDLDSDFGRLAARGAEVVQEPADQPWGIRDCAFRDPAGNLIRINSLG